MSAPLKLSELVAYRSVMTPGPYWSLVVNHEGGRNQFFVESDSRVSVASVTAMADANGLVDTHNAADVLIEIAQAALQYRDAPEGDAAEEQWYVLRDLLAKVQP